MNAILCSILLGLSFCIQAQDSNYIKLPTKALNHKIITDSLSDPDDIVEAYFNWEPFNIKREGFWSFQKRIQKKTHRAIEVEIIQEGGTDDSVLGTKTIFQINYSAEYPKVIYILQQYKCRKGRGQGNWDKTLCK